MKIASLVTLLFSSINSSNVLVSSFTTTSPQTKTASTLNMIPTDGEESNTSDTTRRNMFNKMTSVAAALSVMGGVVQPAYAAGRAPRPTYLTEPTDEFKESERQRMEFRREQLIQKQKMVVLLEKLVSESNDEEALVQDLTDLRTLVIQIGGMPLGIKRDDLIKQVRSKKAKGYWPTSVEYAYQKLTNEITYQQSPNRDKDIANPL